MDVRDYASMTESAMTAMESRLSADIAGLKGDVAGLEQRMDQGFRQIVDRSVVSRLVTDRPATGWPPSPPTSPPLLVR